MPPAGPSNRSNKSRTRGVALRSAALLFFAALGIASVLAAESAVLAELRLLIERGQLQQAEEKLWQLARQQPNDADTIHLMGVLRLAQSRDEEAEALFKRAVGLNAEHGKAHRRLAELYAKQGNHGLAQDMYVRARTLLPHDPEMELGLASVLLAQDEFSEALKLLEALPPDWARPEVLPRLVAAYLGLNQAAQVAALMPEILQHAKDSEALVPKVAAIMVEHGYLPDAAKLLGATRPQATLEYLKVLARVQELQGERKEAGATLVRMRDLFPDDFEPWFEGARFAFQEGQWKEAAELLGRALEIQPNRPDALRQLAIALLRAGEPRRAARAAMRLLTLRPEDADGHYLLGASQAQLQEWPAARKPLEQAAALRDDANTRVALGMVLLNLGEVEAAAEQVERALQLDPDEMEAYYYRGLIARQRGELDVAIRELERVISKNRQHAAAQGTLGSLYLQVGKVEAARAALEQAVTLNPGMPENHYHLAIAYTRLGQPDAARRHMQQYRQLRER